MPYADGRRVLEPLGAGGVGVAVGAGSQEPGPPLAVLAWLMGGAGAEAIRQALAEAQAVVASDLTLVECDRVLARTVVEGRLREAEAAGRQALLARLGHSRGRKRGLPQAGTFSMIEPGPGGSILDER